MNKEELEEIERTLKIAKPYCELGSYHYFNCESIEKLLNENQQLKSTLEEIREYIETHKRKDEFLELNEWGTRELLQIIEESDVK